MLACAVGRQAKGPRVLHIQRVAEADWPTLKSIRLAALQDAPHAFVSRYEDEALKPDEDWRELAAANASDARSAGFIAYQGTDAAGLVACRWMDRGQGLVRLQSLWVTPTARRSGVASSLVERALLWARDVGALACEADVTDANQPTEVFYWRRGFRRVAAHPPRDGVSRWLRDVRQAPAVVWTAEQEGVLLVESNPGWPAKFEEERRLLTPALAPWLESPLEHVGSTAVPGLLAKPVVDVLGAVADLEAACAAISVLEDLGYHYAPYRSRLHWFCKPSAAQRDFHLILLERSHPEWARRLAFRNLLRTDAASARAYVDCKREAARQHPCDREAYTQAKGPLVDALTLEALRRGHGPPGMTPG